MTEVSRLSVVEMYEPPSAGNPTVYLAENHPEITDFLLNSGSHFWFDVEIHYSPNKLMKQQKLMVNIEDRDVALQFKLRFQKIVVDV
jgi:hypothetical protein